MSHDDQAVSSPPKRRGFALLAPDVLRACSARGGRAAWASGRAYRFTSESAREAGRKGGAAAARAKREARAETEALVAAESSGG